jgi:hypothetical protein
MKAIRWMGLALVVVVALVSLGLARPAAPGVGAADEEAVTLYGGANCNPVYASHCCNACQFPTGCLNSCNDPYGCCDTFVGYAYGNNCGTLEGNGSRGGNGHACGGASPGCGTVYATYVPGCGS